MNKVLFHSQKCPFVHDNLNEVFGRKKIIEYGQEHKSRERPHLLRKEEVGGGGGVSQLIGYTLWQSNQPHKK